MKRAIFFYNNIAGRADIADKALRIAQILRSGNYDTEIEAIDFGAYNEGELFKGREGYDLVVVAGGDGTVNYIVNEMKQAGVRGSLGVIPAGTANDFALALGMNRNPLTAAKQIAQGSKMMVDCGYVNGLYFVNIFSFGIFTTTSQRTPNKWKNRMGKFAYILQAFQDLKNLHSIKLRVDADGKIYNINSLMMLVLNGATAGGFHLAHHSNVCDGKLDCMILENRPLLLATIDMLRFVAGGNPSSVHQIRARNIQVVSNDYEPTDADGQRGVDFPLNIECLQHELQIIAPPQTLK